MTATNTDEFEPLSIAEVFGLSPLTERLREAAMALGGDEHTPSSQFGLSSVGILKPRLSLLTWLRWRPRDRRVPLYNLFNHTQTPAQDGWSVRKTQVCDYLGGGCTYDSHNGTDFAVPVGTPVAAAADGEVVRVCNDFHRGGLKVIIDHGRGVMTTSNHLGRSLVEVGQPVGRGQVIALSGASGLDMVALFPWNAPHIHFNVWLDGQPVDPFARAGEVSMWRRANDPTPTPDADIEAGPAQTFEPSLWDMDAVDATIASCGVAELKQQLRDVRPARRRAADTQFYVTYFPTRFDRRPTLVARAHRRRPVLDLPLRRRDYVGVRDPA